MGLEIVALILILLAKAQGRSLFGPPTPAAAASDAQQKAAQAAAEAAHAAQQGDHATAAAKAQEAQQHAKTAAAATKAATTPPPWPQVLPGELPPFPGPGWRPASPVTSAMAARAWQLLPQLWAHGEGTWKAEKTGDRWVVYKAAHTSPGKQGVVAFTTSQQSSAASSDNAPQAMAPQSPPRPSEVVPASTQAAPAAAHAMPVLQLTTPRMTGPSVIYVQQKLGLTADGTYGTGTAAAVSHFQQQHGLGVDGKVGPHTWAALGIGSGQAAA